MNPLNPDQSIFQGHRLNSNNTLPNIFSSFAPDGGFAPTLSGPLFADDAGDCGFNFEGQDNDQNDLKRRRIARACDLCRRRKIKCDGKSPCSHCQNYNTECVYHFEQKARKPAKTARYIEGLENRLGRMEHLLRLSGLLDVDEEGKTDLGVLEQRLAQRASEQNSPSNDLDQLRSKQTHAQMSPNQGTLTYARSPSSRSSSTAPKVTTDKETKQECGDRDSVDDLAELMDSLVTNNHGETRYIGSASGCSIFSPKGIQWVCEKTGDNSFQEMMVSMSMDDNKWYHWKPDVFSDIFERKTYTNLPSKEDCIALLSDFFEHFNHVLPLFHAPTFMHLVDKQYSEDPYEGSGWWASLNVALAVAYRIRCMKFNELEKDEARSWAYFKNALGVLSELTMRNTDLLSIQALIGMSLFLQGTPNPQPSFFLIGAAFRLAHSIGLHKRGSGYGFNSLEIEQRKRVFWIAYMCDKDICLRSGRPPAQDDDDWNVELPSGDPEDGNGNIFLPDGQGKANLFRKMCEFSVIQSKVYNRLYSVKASKQPDGELLNTIGELDQELQQWKDSIPVELRPDHDFTITQPPLIIHLACVHFAYYNCLTTIHRRSILHGYWTSRLAQYAIEGRNVQPLNHRVFSSAALCVSAARMSIALLKYIPPGDYACVWLIIYYPVSALVTLFAHILQNPQDVRARPDLKLIGVVVQFLGQICEDEHSGSINRMYFVCREFERIALRAVESAEKDMSTRQKRKQERDREKIEMTAEYRHRVELRVPRRSMPSPDNASNPSTSSSQLRPTTNALCPEPTTTSSRTPQSIHSISEAQTPIQPAINNGNTFVPNLFGSGDRSSGGNYSFDPSLDAMFNDAYTNTQDIGMFANPALIQPQHYTSGINNNSNGTQFPPGAVDNGSNMRGSNVINNGDDDNGGGNNGDAGYNMGPNYSTSTSSFQPGFAPQDLWSMPMTFEWDWADLAGSGIGLGQF